VIGLTHASKADERIVVNAKINGKPIRFVFDTGAENTALFSSTAKRLNLSVTYPPKGTKAEPGRVLTGISEKCQTEMIGQSATGRLRVLDVPSYFAKNIDGVVSWNALRPRNGLLRIDSNNNTATGLTALPHDIDQWSKWNLNTNANILAFSLTNTPLGNGAIFIDTGTPRGLELCPKLWKKWQRDQSDQASTLNATYTPASGLLVSSEYWTDQWNIGGFSIDNVPVTQAVPEAKHAFKNHLATLGLFALTRFNIIIDKKNNTIYIKKNLNPKAVYQQNRVGAVFVPINMQNKDLVAHVVKGSPGYNAGIRDKDILLSIGNLDVTKWRTDPRVLPLSRFWEQPAGTKLKLSLRRNEERFEATVILKEILRKKT
ncbi:aspartyl protease family protein, partial [Verrucomicrobiota bacterium]